MIKLKEKINSKWYYAMAMLMTVMCTITPTYADIVNDAEKAINKIGDALIGIAAPLAGLMAVIALICALTSSGQTFERNITWLKRILVILAAILCVGGIISFITDNIGGGDFNIH